VTSP
jgi:hypothetical protein